MISGNKKLRIIRCNESELTEENSKYPVTEGYVYICEDTENVYFDDSDNKRHLVNGKSLDGSTTFIINELVKQNIEYKNLLNSINATQSLVSPQNEEQKIKFDSVSDLLNSSTILNYSSNNFSEIPCITIKSVNVREDWAKPYYRYATIEDASKTSAKLVFKFDESIANENNRGPINIDVDYTLSGSQTTSDIYSSGAGIDIDKNNKSISLSDSGVSANTYGPSANVTGTNNSTILIPKITVDRFGRVTNIANITYTSKDTTYVAATQSAQGLMSAEDKKKLDGIASGAQVNAVTSVAGKTGAVTLAKGDVGLGNVENKSSATIRGELTKANVTTALGYTPPTTNTTYGAGSGLSLGSDNKFSINSTYISRLTNHENIYVDSETSYNHPYYLNFETNESNPTATDKLIATLDMSSDQNWRYIDVYASFPASSARNCFSMYIPGGNGEESNLTMRFTNINNENDSTSLAHAEGLIVFKRENNKVMVYARRAVYWYWNGKITSNASTYNGKTYKDAYGNESCIGIRRIRARYY